MRHLLFVLFLCVLSTPSIAIDPEHLEDPQQQQRYLALIHELRCLKCQGETVADTPAMFAVDIRRQVRSMVQEGRSDEEIKQFLVERYGEFVLYRPQFGGSTLLLWLGPAVVLLAGAAVLVVVVRRRASANRVAAVPVDDDSQEW